jgi:hypothetical protein
MTIATVPTTSHARYIRVEVRIEQSGNADEYLLIAAGESYFIALPESDKPATWSLESLPVNGKLTVRDLEAAKACPFCRMNIALLHNIHRQELVHHVIDAHT